MHYGVRNEGGEISRGGSAKEKERKEELAILFPVLLEISLPKTFTKHE